VSATLDKLQHSQRQEAAQQRREEKVRARKERNMLLSESDPEKVRKLEVRGKLQCCFCNYVQLAVNRINGVCSC